MLAKKPPGVTARGYCTKRATWYDARKCPFVATSAERTDIKQELYLTWAPAEAEGALVNSLSQGVVPKWLREGSAKPSFSGSNPLDASTSYFETQ